MLYELRNDSTILSNDHWTLLSNAIHSYDEFNQINRLQQLMLQKNAILPKLRMKSRDMLNVFNEIIIGIQPLMERSSHFQILPKDMIRRLFYRNMAITGGVNAMFITRETHIREDAGYATMCALVYGPDFLINSRKLENRLENNGNLIKLYLFVLIFSTNCKFLSHNQIDDYDIETNTIKLFHIQNIYIEILWRYMIYLYGYQQAASRFTALIIDSLCIVMLAKHVSDESAHNMLVEGVVTHIESALSITNE